MQNKDKRCEVTSFNIQPTRSFDCSKTLLHTNNKVAGRAPLLSMVTQDHCNQQKQKSCQIAKKSESTDQCIQQLKTMPSIAISYACQANVPNQLNPLIVPDRNYTM